MYRAHEDLLGELSERDRQICRGLIGRQPIADGEATALVEQYVQRLMQCNAIKSLYEHDEVLELLLQARKKLEAKLPKAKRRPAQELQDRN